MYHIETKSGSKINTKGGHKEAWVDTRSTLGGGWGGTDGRTGGNRGSVDLCFLRKAALTERDGETPRVSVRTGIAELGLLGRTDGCGRALRRRRVRRERTNKNSRGRVWISSFVFRKYWHHTYLRGTFSLDRNEVILLMRARTFVSLAVFCSSRVFVGSLVSFFLSFFLSFLGACFCKTSLLTLSCR